MDKVELEGCGGPAAAVLALVVTAFVVSTLAPMPLVKVPVLGQPASESLPLPSSAVPPVERSYLILSMSAESQHSIGTAEMDANGTISMHLSAPPRAAPDKGIRPLVPWPPPEEQLGYGQVQLDRWDPHYDDLLRHLGGLLPGQMKQVPPWRPDEKWHCAFDPDRGPCPLHHRLPDIAPIP